MFTHLEHEQVFKYQKAFGYSTGDLDAIIAPMAVEGKEPIGSMGTDTPLAILSDQQQHLSSYFKHISHRLPIRRSIRYVKISDVISGTFVGNNGNFITRGPADMS